MTQKKNTYPNMFKCKKCNSIDNFGLVFNPNYSGKGEFFQTVNEHDEIVFNILFFLKTIKKFLVLLIVP